MKSTGISLIVIGVVVVDAELRTFTLVLSMFQLVRG